MSLFTEMRMVLKLQVARLGVWCPKLLVACLCTGRGRQHLTCYFYASFAQFLLHDIYPPAFFFSLSSHGAVFLYLYSVYIYILEPRIGKRRAFVREASAPL